MNPESIRQLLRARPFEPFEIRMSNGDVYPVRHPENAIPTGSRLVWVDPADDVVNILSLLHITGYRMLQPAAQA